jgi:hypothetical protein
MEKSPVAGLEGDVYVNIISGFEGGRGCGRRKKFIM